MSKHELKVTDTDRNETIVFEVNDAKTHVKVTWKEENVPVKLNELLERVPDEKPEGMRQSKVGNYKIEYARWIWESLLEHDDRVTTD